MTSSNPMLTWVSLQHLSSFLAHELDGMLREKLGVSTLESNLLGHLARKGVEWRMSDFTEALLLSKAGVTKLIDRLEADELVERGRMPSDRRVTLVHITPKGTALLRQARAETELFVKENFLEHLSEGEREGLSTGLRTVLEGHGRWGGQLRFLAASDR